MIKEGTNIKFLKLDVINKLANNNNIYDGYLESLFKEELNYYQFINFKFIPERFNSVFLNPSFIFFETIETCEKVEVLENDKILCHTENFIIDYFNAIENKEIEIIDKTINQGLGINPKIEFSEFVEEILECFDNYDKGYITKKELLGLGMISVNNTLCYRQGIFEGTHTIHIL